MTENSADTPDLGFAESVLLELGDQDGLTNPQNLIFPPSSCPRGVDGDEQGTDSQSDGERHPPLHPTNCQGGLEDIEDMRRTLEQDQESLERRQIASVGFVVETLPLHDAVRARHPECVRFLLESGANPDAYDNGTMYTPLGFAILLTHSDCPENIVELLLQNGASTSLDHGLYYSRTAYLEDSITKRWPKVMEMLLEYGSDLEDMIINEKGEKQLRRRTEPPIIEAIWRQKTDILRLLLLRGASLNFNNFNGNKNSIPHNILNFYKSADRALEALRVYREFGGDILVQKTSSKNSEDNTVKHYTIFDSLQAKPDKYGFKDSTQEFIKELEDMISTPLSLQSQCRLTIKNVMGVEYWRKVSLLPLPLDVKKFLLFMELVITEIEDNDDDVYI